jgi:surface polysaccharide O-acyltransferase-like enzyme
MLIHRPAYNLSPIHSVIYFIPLYLLGIIYSINEQPISNFIKNKSFMFGLATLLISIIQILRNNSFGNYHKETMISYGGIDIIIIQKIFMIFFFLSILQKIDKKEIGILKYIASVSFAIYFLHPWVLWFLGYYSVTDYASFLPGIIIFPLKTILVIGICLAVATLFNVIFGNRSRYVIGW